MAQEPKAKAWLLRKSDRLGTRKEIAMRMDFALAVDAGR